MNQEIKAKWIKALNSGEFEQTDGALCSNNQYCCLGVLGKIMGYDVEAEENKWGHERDAIEELLNETIIEEAGLSYDDQEYLARLNDGHAPTHTKRHNFSEIADYIEKTF